MNDKFRNLIDNAGPRFDISSFSEILDATETSYLEIFYKSDNTRIF